MWKMIKDFHIEMSRGLAGRPSSLKMLPAYVDRPTGREKGKFIALDLGGTNFRVLDICLKGSGASSKPRAMKFVLKKKLVKGSADPLFGFLADSISRFLRKEKIGPARAIDMGFTFSFPMKQKGVASGSLVLWTKGFNVRGVIGKDVVALLKKALDKKGLGRVRIAALANDTVGTMVARSYSDPHCDVGVIIGTGTNACYAEKLANIRKLNGPKMGSMIVNIEWGNFNKLEKTSYDKKLDASSDRPGEQVLEKMVSGMYIGELARLVIKGLIGKKAIFNGTSSPGLEKAYNFRTEYVSEAASDRSHNLGKMKSRLKSLGIPNSTLEDRRTVKSVCEMVSARAARVSGAAVAAVITKMDPTLSKMHTVAVDGSVYEKLPRFSKNIAKALQEIFGRKAGRIRLVLTKDGSGKGAAIIAAVAASGE